MKLIASPLALDLLLALSQRPEGARLTDLAGAAGAPLSSAERAIGLLVADGVAGRHGRTRPLYRPHADHPGLAALLDLAHVASPAERALEVILRACPAVEFAARDPQGYLVVRSATAEPAHLVALRRGLGRLGAVRDAPPVASYEHDDLRDMLRDDPSPQERARRARVIKGSVPRSFPAPRRRRDRAGKPLGRPHPSVPHISQRALRSLARAHGLRRIALFGSAVRSDFRPDSDIDVLVEPRPEARVSLLDLAAIAQRLERLFDRDVDVLTPGALHPEARARIEREAIPLHG